MTYQYSEAQDQIAELTALGVNFNLKLHTLGAMRLGAFMSDKKASPDYKMSHS